MNIFYSRQSDKAISRMDTAEKQRIRQAIQDIKKLEGYSDGRKRLVLAWDPDYTKVTPAESDTIEQGLEEIKRGEFVRHEDIDWG
jgi:predicted transcriptional regulator